MPSSDENNDNSSNQVDAEKASIRPIIHRRSSSRDELLMSPADQYNLVYIGFVVLGIATLLPWNFFITATDYWKYKFRNVNTTEPNGSSENDRSPLQIFFESYLAIASNVALLLTMLVNTFYGQRFAPKKRIYVSLSVMLIIFALTTTFAPINTDKWQYLFFGMTIILVGLISSFSAIFQAAIFGLVSYFPSYCMKGMVNGQAVAGLIAVLVQIISMMNNSGPIVSGLWYFLASTLFIGASIVYFWSMDTEYFRHYISAPPDMGSNENLDLRTNKLRMIMESLKDCWQLAASVTIVFTATLAIFPGVCVLVIPQYPDSDFFTGHFFHPITTFLLYNLGDLAGRLCASYVEFPTNRKTELLIITSIRSFIPLLILFCNVQPRSAPIWFKSDIYYPILITLTSLTNGYLFSAAMVMASKNSQKMHSELTGFVMATSLGIGLTLGSIGSTILLRLI